MAKIKLSDYKKVKLSEIKAGSGFVFSPGTSLFKVMEHLPEKNLTAVYDTAYLYKEMGSPIIPVDTNEVVYILKDRTSLYPSVK